MKRLLTFGLPILTLLVIGLLVAPSFLDLNQYKSRITEEVKKATGYDVVVAGNISAALLPAPKAMIENLSVKAPKGKEETLLTLERADVSVKLLPLLSKEIVVDSVKLKKPDIRIEKLADGSFSYLTDQLQNAKKDQATPKKAAPNVVFDRIEIEDGTLIYTDQMANKTQTVKNLNMALRVETLSGPFKTGGFGSVNNQEIEFSAKLGLLKPEGGNVPVQFDVTLPASNTQISFSGTADQAKQALDGQMAFETESVGGLAKLAQAELPASLNKPFELQGALKGSPKSINISANALSFDSAQGKGSIQIDGLDTRKPVTLKAVLQSDGVLDIDALLPKANKKDQTKSSGAIVPPSLQFPFPLEADIQAQLAAVKMGGQAYQSVKLTALKKGGTITVDKSITKAPGDMSLQAGADLKYGSSSTSPKTGAVTYTDPSLTFNGKGDIGSIAKLANAYNIQLAPQARNISAANFNVNGALVGQKLVLNDSVLKLYQTTAGLSGSYTPSKEGRAKLVADISADTVDFDKFIGGSKEAAATKDPAKALEPLKNFALPFDADFDVSIQNATFQDKAIKGLRLQGQSRPNTLKLTQAGVNNYLGSSFSAKGTIGDLKALSGLDVNLLAKTGNVRDLLQKLGQKVDGLPQQIGAAEANVNLKGKLEAAAFAANIKALNGKLDAEGDVLNVLTKPQFSNLTLGASHPNFVKAMQVINPEFKAGTGLQQKIEISSKVNQSGKVYNLSNINANFGPMSIAGDMKFDMGGAKPSITGDVALGDVLLDSFLGDEEAQKARKSKGASSSSKSGTERYSRRPIDVSWINNANVDLGITAKSIQYGGWNLTQPKTRLSMAPGALKVSDLTASAFGGSAKFDATVSPVNNGGVSMAMTGALGDVALDQLVFALSNSNDLKAQGTVSLDMDVQSSGGSNYALVNALGGKANLKGRNVVMEGFDLGKLAGALRDDIKIGNSVEAVMSGARSGTTKLDTIDGQYDIKNGVVNITSMIMDGPAAQISSKGNASLPKWYLDTVHSISLKNAGEGVPPFDVSIKGPLDKPGNTFGQGIIRDFVQRKIERKVQKEIGNVIGKELEGSKLGETLKQFGIGGQQAQPTPTPAPETQAPAAGNEAAPAETQQEQAPDKASPFDGVFDESDDTERAIKGVLDGLLR